MHNRSKALGTLTHSTPYSSKQKFQQALKPYDEEEYLWQFWQNLQPHFLAKNVAQAPMNCQYQANKLVTIAKKTLFIYDNPALFQNKY